jgi:hypothetical protein
MVVKKEILTIWRVFMVGKEKYLLGTKYFVHLHFNSTSSVRVHTHRGGGRLFNYSL